jgi:hypothetical protein
MIWTIVDWFAVRSVWNWGMIQGWSMLAVTLVVAFCAMMWNPFHHADDAEPEALPVNLMALLVDPAAYNGKYVRVTGFFVYATEECVLYQDEESAKLGIIPNSIWVGGIPSDMSEETLGDYSGRWVEITGWFDDGATGTYDFYRGSLSVDGIRRCKEYPERYLTKVEKEYLVASELDGNGGLTGWKVGDPQGIEEVRKWIKANVDRSITKNEIGAVRARYAVEFRISKAVDGSKKDVPADRVDIYEYQSGRDTKPLVSKEKLSALGSIFEKYGQKVTPELGM